MLLIADHDQAHCEELRSELAADEPVDATSTRSLSLQLENHRPALLVLNDFEVPGASARLLAALPGGQESFAGDLQALPMFERRTWRRLEASTGPG